jgi:hypothetical protein
MLITLRVTLIVPKSDAEKTMHMDLGTYMAENELVLTQSLLGSSMLCRKMCQ